MPKNTDKEKKERENCHYRSIADPMNCFYYGCLYALNGYCCLLEDSACKDSPKID